MIFTTLTNGLMAWLMLITFCFCLGSLEDATSTPTGYAFIYVFHNATHSLAGTNAMSSIVIFMNFFCAVAIMATASRQLFAFARDKGIPFANVFAHVPPRSAVPVNAVLFTFVVSCLLALINIGSSVAFNSVSSVSLAALLSSFGVSIGCVILKRVRGEELLDSGFKLGRWGLPLNVVSVVFLAFIFVMSFFPPGTDPTPDLMNWSVVMYCGLVVCSLGYYFAYGRKVYVGPVEYVRKSA